MILFVFEGEATEPLLYSSIKHLFMPKEKNDIICSYKSNIYSLYNRMLANGYFDDAENDVSIVPLLQTHLRKQRELNHPLLKIKRWAEISEVFLFFDYDCQNKNSNGTYSLGDNNRQIQEMLSFFNNETSAGKLYINYPMIESIRYTKKLPDSAFGTYTAPLTECPDAVFKNKVDAFSFYKSFDFLTLNFLDSLRDVMNLAEAKSRKLKLRSFWKQRKKRKDNWKMLIKQNVEKLFEITNADKTEIHSKQEITQEKLFEVQRKDFVSKQIISIICSLPLFLYDYIPVERWLKEKAEVV